MRLQEYDILKGIGILLVVLGHTGISGLPYTYIYAFHMPLFFFVSGCFYKQYAFYEILKKRLKSLLLPWFCFAVLFLMTNIAISYFESNNLRDSITSNLLALDVMDEDCRSLFRTIWFLLSLFEISVIYALLDKLPRYGKLGGVLLCFFIGCILSNRVDVSLFLDSTLSCVIYYHLGHEFMHSRCSQNDIKKWIPWGAIVVLSAIIVYLRPDVNMARNIYPWYLPAISVTYTITLYHIVKQLQYIIPDVVNKLLICFGKDSLLILGFHRFFFIIFEVITPIVGLTGLVLCGVKFLAVLPLVYLIKRPIEKYMPFFLGKTNF